MTEPSSNWKSSPAPERRHAPEPGHTSPQQAGQPFPLWSLFLSGFLFLGLFSGLALSLGEPSSLAQGGVAAQNSAEAAPAEASAEAPFSEPVSEPVSASGSEQGQALAANAERAEEAPKLTQPGSSDADSEHEKSASGLLLASLPSYDSALRGGCGLAEASRETPPEAAPEADKAAAKGGEAGGAAPSPDNQITDKQSPDAFTNETGAEGQAAAGNGESAEDAAAPDAEKTSGKSARTEARPDQASSPAEPGQAVDPARLDPAWKPLITRLAADGFERGEMERLFAGLGPKSYSPAYMAAKITELYGVGGIGIRRNEAPELPDEYEQPLSDFTVGSCLEFLRLYEEEFAAIRSKFGVPPEVIIGLLLVETGLGLDLGSDIAFRALAGMAATNTIERLGSAGNNAQTARVRASSLAATLKDKSNWAYNEVKAIINYGKMTGFDICKLPGSIYGAIGICQFMPSNIEPYGADGDGDGVVDVFSVVDAMYSVASYLEANGWRGAGSNQQKLAVFRSYNHDTIYAARVLGASNHIAKAINGKVSAKSSALGGFAGVSGRLDPSLRRLRSPRPSTRVGSLGNYADLLN